MKMCRHEILAAAVVLTSLLSGPVFAQDAGVYGVARPMFAVLPPHGGNNEAVLPATQLPQWTFSFTYGGTTYNDVMIGTNPASTNSTTVLQWGIIPIKMVYGTGNGNTTFDPKSIYSGNMTAIQEVANSPLFRALVDYVQGGTDLGTTQYGDAYVRGDFWQDVQVNTNYHLKFGKRMLFAEQTLTVPVGLGHVISNPWSGVPTGTANINWFDLQLQALITKLKIQPNVLPLFLTYNVYLTSGGCCIGGYHSALAGPPSGQTYAFTTTVSQSTVPVFSQDIGAASHEIGEWIMDPFGSNNSPCGVMENGDPLETEPNFGDFPYTVNGFTYHPQDLVFVDYFGAPTSLPVNGWYTFQNETNANSVCSRGA